MLLRIGAAVLWSTALALAGCDPCRTIQQTVVLSVERNEGEQSVEGLRIRIREVWERTEENARFDDANPGRRIASMWFSAIVDADGSVETAVIESAMDDTRSGPPIHREAVVGHKFECEIRDGDGILQSFKAVFREGEVIAGNLFTVSIISISKPWYSREEEELVRSVSPRSPFSVRGCVASGAGPAVAKDALVVRLEQRGHIFRSGFVCS